MDELKIFILRQIRWVGGFGRRGMVCRHVGGFIGAIGVDSVEKGVEYAIKSTTIRNF